MADFSALKAAIRAAIRQNGNNEITGNIMQGILLSMVNTLGDAAINALVDAVAALSTRVADGYMYGGIATPTSTPTASSGKVFYFALQAGTYTNYGALVVEQGVTILKTDNYQWTKDVVWLIDNEPTAGSDNLVKSGGVQNELALGAVYDVSAKNPTAGPNNNGKWESLSALLSDANLNTLIPTAVRKGGMTIRFVQSSDNKYVQYRLMTDSFSTILSDWISENEIWDGSAYHKDLLFADEFNNIIGGFKHGHVVSKFPSPYVDNSKRDNLELVDEDGNVVFSVKEGYPETKNFDGKELSDTVRKLVDDTIQTITVSVADHGYNLKKCFESISPSKNKHYIVLIPEGTYDIRSYYDEHIYGAGLYVPDYVRLQGIGAKEKIIIQYRNTVDEWFSSRSTLNLHEWVEMDNLTVVSQYIRYTIHADTQTDTPYQKYFKITNCSFKHYNGYYPQAWGAGLKANTLCIFENCEFFSDFVNHEGHNVVEKPVFSYHNNGYGYTSSQIILKNCRLTNAGDGAVLAFYGYNEAQSQMMYVTLVGCKLNTYAYIGEYNEGNNGPEAKITGYANVMAQEPVIDVAESYTYSDYIDLI